jgi:hypothetical protein
MLNNVYFSRQYHMKVIIIVVVELLIGVRKVLLFNAN